MFSAVAEALLGASAGYADIHAALEDPAFVTTGKAGRDSWLHVRRSAGQASAELAAMSRFLDVLPAGVHPPADVTAALSRLLASLVILAFAEDSSTISELPLPAPDEIRELLGSDEAAAWLEAYLP